MENPPIVRVVVQVAYPPAARLGTPSGVAELQEALEGHFQLQSQGPAGFQISFGGPPAVMPTTNSVFGHAEGYELTVGQDSLTLAIDHRYRDRAAFAVVLEPVLASVAGIGRLKDYTRLGVRYINAAPASADEFRTWFKPEFVGWAGGDVVATDANPTWVLITQLARTEPSSPITNGVIRYGYLQSGVGTDITTSPAGAAPSFIADIDLGSQRPGAFDGAIITEAFRNINHEIAAFFENSMTHAGIEHFALRTKEA
ncbi:MAG: TIGR04255 family protein [Vulcanimicrobiaceae bacterium]